MRQIRERHQQRRALLLDLIDLDLELPDLLRPCLVRGEDPRRILPLTLGARDLVAGGILLALEALDFRNQAAAARFECRKLFQLGVHREPAVLVRRADLVQVIADVGGIDHP